jgi:hypothetical protein
MYGTKNIKFKKTRIFFGGKARPALGADDSAFLVVPNVKVMMGAHYSFPTA